MTNTLTISRELADELLDACSSMGWTVAEKLRAILAAKPQCWPCWSCHAPVTMANRADADGNCPHCEAELDIEDWPFPDGVAAPVVERPEPVAWMALNRDGFPEKCLPSDPEGFPVYRSPPAPVAVEFTDDQLIEMAKMSAALCSEQHPYMDRALHLDWQPHKWVIDAMRKVAAPLAVLLPERMPTGNNVEGEFNRLSPGPREGWNMCLDKVKEMNR